LVGYWPLDEGAGTTTADQAAGGNAGALSSGVTWTSGRFDNALHFDGVSGYLSAGARGLPAANAPQSISWWLNVPTIPSGVQDIIALTDDVGRSGVQPGFRYGQVGVWKWGGAWLVATMPPASGGWHHYAYTFDGATHRLYVDGALQASATTTPEAGAPTTVQIGRWSGGHEYLGGSVDDVRIYNRALNGAEARILAGAP